jgi:hypothetical protein
MLNYDFPPLQSTAKFITPSLGPQKRTGNLFSSSLSLDRLWGSRRPRRGKSTFQPVGCFAPHRLEGFLPRRGAGTPTIDQMNVYNKQEKGRAALDTARRLTTPSSGIQNLYTRCQAWSSSKSGPVQPKLIAPGPHDAMQPTSS